MLINEKKPKWAQPLNFFKRNIRNSKAKNWEIHFKIKKQQNLTTKMFILLMDILYINY